MSLNVLVYMKHSRTFTVILSSITTAITMANHRVLGLFQYDMCIQCFMFFSGISLEAYIPPKPGAKKKKKVQTLKVQQWRDRTEKKVLLLRNCVALIGKNTPGVTNLLKKFDVIKTTTKKKSKDSKNDHEEDEDAGDGGK